MKDHNLWLALEKFEVDAGDETLTFIQRLARENGWSISFARKVFTEYKKFIFLAIISPGQVTPSDQVDQAWHLHLSYTQSYWNDLCGRILPRPLHHGPTKGGPAEDDRFWQQYEDTLSLYRQAFAQSAPSEIWPSARERFHQKNQFVRVNRRKDLVIPRLAVPVILALLFIASAVYLQFNHPVALPGFPAVNTHSSVSPEIIIAAIVLFILLKILSAVFGSGKKNKKDKPWWWGSGGGGCGSGCTSGGCGGGGCGGGGCGGD